MGYNNNYNNTTMNLFLEVFYVVIILEIVSTSEIKKKRILGEKKPDVFVAKCVTMMKLGEPAFLL